ncbi:Ribosomal RNA small subunit methyltransferase D [Roseimaritima multifibrata]|uniref:Ribosomal RNA small subunit methyltransferase D n=1 Tax=Roseimaritima multifibrata TaxID=1930274 RepID=A0A517MER8_9BACT|nr:RsmD family RNA methyltransferase [Roseimaritima multifibrata]QDS93257.1 Ribosomal RNA small subunit methyltransferase D [Roseimaritima multifibrata]
MAGPRKTRTRTTRKSADTLKTIGPTNLRVIGGSMGGRQIRYNGQRSTRPMKDSVRENLFNVLGKHAVQGAIAWDLFAGTGILGIEAVSRGAERAVCFEWNRPMAKSIQTAIDSLDAQEKVKVVIGDAFRMSRHMMSEEEEPKPWIVFVCPPYIFWEEKVDQMFDMLRWIAEHAPQGSVVVTETDGHWDMEQLPLEPWDIRRYGSTQLGFYEPPALCGGL